MGGDGFSWRGTVHITVAHGMLTSLFKDISSEGFPWEEEKLPHGMKKEYLYLSYSSMLPPEYTS